MSKITQNIVRSIKEGLWLDIIYDNLKGETHYWISINDIDSFTKKINCNVINVKLDNSYQDNWTIFFNKIKSAKVIEGTKCSVNEELVRNIETNPYEYKFLNYTLYKQNVLDYFNHCYKEDSTPFLNDFTLIKHIDVDELKKSNRYKLNENQFDNMINLIKRNLDNKKDISNIIDNKMCINTMSISTSKGIFPIVYREVLFDIKSKSLVLDENVRFNKEFLYGSKNKKISFSNYFNFEIDSFINNFDLMHQEYKDILNQNLYKSETVDTRPYLFELQRNYMVNLEIEYEAISKLSDQNNLSTPLKAFFCGLTRKNIKASKKPIVLLDEKVNIDQLRVIYNSVNKRVTYVQGPPGTGKTRTILNVLITALYNNQRVLVSSNNNQPLDNIIVDLSEYKYDDKPIHLPLLRLGNYESVKTALLMVNKHFHDYNDIILATNEDVGLDKYVSELKDVIEILDNCELRENKEEELQALEKLLEITRGSLRSLKIIKRVNEIKEDLNILPEYTNEDVISKLIIEKIILHKFLYNMSVKQYQKLNNERYSELKNLLIFEKNVKITNKHVAKLKKYIRNDSGLKELTDIFPIILSTNLSANYLGSAKQSFDLTIMDEAGQCNPATALIPIIRGERLLLVGDTNQLQPIVSIDEEHNSKLMNIFRVSNLYNYRENSILHIMQKADRISKFILLKYHYRCTPEIIGYSNSKYYGNELIIMTESDKESLVLKHVDSTPDVKNVSTKEIVQVIKEIRSSRESSIGVITPFRAQAKEIEKRLKEFGHSDISVGTVHTFQGDEKEKIIFSLGVTESTYPQTFDWIKNNRELINVATTRAMKRLVMICDTKEVIRKSKNDPTNGIYELMKYLKKKGKYQVTDDSSDIFKQGMNRGKKLNSEYEEEFLTTIKHVLSFNEGLKIQPKMRIADVLSEIDVSYENMQYFLQSHFDFVIYSKRTNLPLLAIEINGIEHYTQEAVMERDKKKKKICESKNMKLLIIPNDYVRRYELIKDEIVNILH